MNRAQAERMALRAEGLTRDYGDGPVLADVSLTLAPGEAPLGVIGPSGCGKTTLVNLLMGWDRPTAGGVAFGPHAPYRPRVGARRAVRAALRGVHEEADPAVDQRLPNARVLAARRRLARRAGRSSDLDDDGLLALVGLSPAVLGRIPRETALGERQRFAAALALVTDPDVLILDEPTTALDPDAAEQLLTAVVGYAVGRGAAVLVVSHNLGLIGAVTAEVIALYEGRVIGRGPLDRLLAAPGHPYLAELAAIRAAEAVTRRPGVGGTGGG
jgi:ABC-type glutathione transport system ATPase component